MNQRKKRERKKVNQMGEANNRLKGINGADGAEAAPLRRVPASEADWLAGQLHEARANNCDLRNTLLQRDKSIIEKDQAIITLRQRLLKLTADNLNKSNDEVNKSNAELREKHGLVIGRTLRRDDVTGEVYWEIEQTETS